MKLIRVMSKIGVDGLETREEPTPEPRGREVLIRVKAASLNFRDLTIVRGHYPGSLKEQPVPLSDGAGEVVATGPEVTRTRAGDRVTVNCFPHWIGGPFVEDYHPHSVGMTQDGMLAEYCLVDENGIVAIPDYISYEEAAAMPCAAVSAWSALTFASSLSPGQTVLVQGTGGVALFGLQIARMFGARVFAITSTEEKAEILRSMGAEAVINYRETPEWSASILELTGGKGVDKVVEIGGETTIGQSVASTRIGGEIGLVGFVTGFGGGLPPLSILARSIVIKGTSIGPRLSFEALLKAMDVTKVRPVVDRVFAFDDHKAAYRHLESGSHVGKVVIGMDA